MIQVQLGFSSDWQPGFKGLSSTVANSGIATIMPRKGFSYQYLFFFFLSFFLPWHFYFANKMLKEKDKEKRNKIRRKEGTREGRKKGKEEGRKEGKTEIRMEGRKKEKAENKKKNSFDRCIESIVAEWSQWPHVVQPSLITYTWSTITTSRAGG